MILPIFDCCDVAWHGCGKVNSDVLESLQHRAAKLIFPNSGLDTKELNATLSLVPLINRRKLHIVLLVRKCLDGSVPPYLNNYQFNLNTSVHTRLDAVMTFIFQKSTFYRQEIFLFYRCDRI